MMNVTRCSWTAFFQTSPSRAHKCSGFDFDALHALIRMLVGPMANRACAALHVQGGPRPNGPAQSAIQVTGLGCGGRTLCNSAKGVTAGSPIHVSVCSILTGKGTQPSCASLATSHVEGRSVAAAGASLNRLDASARRFWTFPERAGQDALRLSGCSRRSFHHLNLLVQANWASILA